MLKGIDTAQHYEELIPGNTNEAKESHRHADVTLERIEAMMFDAFCKGIHLSLKPIGLKDKFKEGPPGASDNAPKLKISEIMAEKAISREILQRSRSEEAPG